MAGYKNGFTLQSESGDFVLKVTGYAHADGRFASGDEAEAVTDQFLVRRARPIVQGTVAKYFDFYLNPDFGGGATVIQDAYVDVRFTPKLRFRVGKIKTPFGIERLQSGTEPALRGAGAAQQPGAEPRHRAAGARRAVAGGGRLSARGASTAWRTAAASTRDNNDSKDLAGRLFVQPWRAKGNSPLRGPGLRRGGYGGEGHRPAAPLRLGLPGARLRVRGHRHRQRRPAPVVAAGLRSSSAPSASSPST